MSEIVELSENATSGDFYDNKHEKPDRGLCMLIVHPDFETLSKEDLSDGDYEKLCDAEDLRKKALSAAEDYGFTAFTLNASKFPDAAVRTCGVYRKSLDRLNAYVEVTG